VGREGVGCLIPLLSYTQNLDKSAKIPKQMQRQHQVIVNLLMTTQDPDMHTNKYTQDCRLHKLHHKYTTRAPGIHRWDCQLQQKLWTTSPVQLHITHLCYFGL